MRDVPLAPTADSAGSLAAPTLGKISATKANKRRGPPLAPRYKVGHALIPWSNQNAGWGGKYSDYLGLYYPPYTRWDCCQSANFGRCDDNYPPKMPVDCMDTDPNYTVSSIAPLIIPTHDDDYDGEVGKEEAIANIKGALISNKGVNFNFFLDDFGPFFEFWDDSPEDAIWMPSPGKSYSKGVNRGGHAVLCVGYDDTDPNNRYWVMLNSWGAPANRPHGLFRVSMDMDYSYVFEEGLNAFGWFTFDVDYSEDGMPPQSPSRPYGPNRGLSGRSYRYSTSANDPDGDPLTYTFDWGDGITTITPPVPSGTRADASHAWASAGTYQIRVKAVDSKGASSEWTRVSVDIV